MLLKGVGMRLYFRVNKWHSLRFITEASLGFEKVCPQIELLNHMLFCLWYSFLSVNLFPVDLPFKSLFEKHQCLPCCMALFSFRVLHSFFFVSYLPSFCIAASLFSHPFSTTSFSSPFSAYFSHSPDPTDPQLPWLPFSPLLLSVLGVIRESPKGSHVMVTFSRSLKNIFGRPTDL